MSQTTVTKRENPKPSGASVTLLETISKFGSPHGELLSLCFSALADPTRRYILEQLRRGSHTVSELAEPLPMSLPAVQKHLRVLESAGLVVTQKTGRTRHCQLHAGPMVDTVAYLSGYEAFWSGSNRRMPGGLVTSGTP